MRKINVKELIDFRRKSDRRKNTFITELKATDVIEEEVSSGGRDYWIRSLTALSAAFKDSDNAIISERIENILNDYDPKMLEKTKKMYDRNLQILHNFEDYDFNDLKPTSEIKILSKSRKKGTLEIKGLPIKILLHQIYSFRNLEDIECIGSILFLAKLDSYKPHELGIFAEAVFRFLYDNYGDNYVLSPSDIKITDVMINETVSYQMVLDGQIPSLLYSTLDEIIKLKNKN